MAFRQKHIDGFFRFALVEEGMGTSRKITFKMKTLKWKLLVGVCMKELITKNDFMVPGTLLFIQTGLPLAMAASSGAAEEALFLTH